MRFIFLVYICFMSPVVYGKESILDFHLPCAENEKNCIEFENEGVKYLISKDSKLIVKSENIVAVELKYLKDLRDKTGVEWYNLDVNFDDDIRGNFQFLKIQNLNKKIFVFIDGICVMVMTVMTHRKTNLTFVLKKEDFEKESYAWLFARQKEIDEFHKQVGHKEWMIEFVAILWVLFLCFRI